MSDVLDAALRPVLSNGLRFALKPVLTPAVPFGIQRTWATLAARASTIVPAASLVTREQLGNVATERIRLPDARGDAAALYFHGGGFCIGSPQSHRAIGARLALAIGAPVYVPDYRLAPEHRFPAALDDALEAYDAVVSRGFAPANLALIGDSAGGGLALSLLLALRTRGSHLPACAVLLSPWLDLTLSGATIALNRTIDPLVSGPWLAKCAEAYRGDVAANDPRVSPLFAPLAGLSPIAVHVGTREILLDDAARFAVAAEAAGLELDYRRYEGLWHNSQLQGGVLPSAQASYDDAARFITGHWPQSTAS